MEQNLIEFYLLATDSVKLRANANYKQGKTLAGRSSPYSPVKSAAKQRWF